MNRFIDPEDRRPILVVDDDGTDVMLAQRCLRRSRLSNPMVPIPGGQELLDYLDGVLGGRHEMPVLVLLDINMPRMNGFEVLAEIRKRSEFSRIPVIMMLTNSDQPEERRRALSLGANAFQTKPMHLEEYVRFFDSLIGAA